MQLISSWPECQGIRFKLKYPSLASSFAVDLLSIMLWSDVPLHSGIEQASWFSEYNGPTIHFLMMLWYEGSLTDELSLIISAITTKLLHFIKVQRYHEWSVSYLTTLYVPIIMWIACSLSHRLGVVLKWHVEPVVLIMPFFPGVELPEFETCHSPLCDIGVIIWFIADVSWYAFSVIGCTQIESRIFVRFRLLGWNTNNTKEVPSQMTVILLA
jgi:hypothetical protein